jgi:release factor glutamine methyltransferase
VTQRVGDAALAAARAFAAQSGSEEGRRDAQVLLGFALGVSWAWLIAHSGDTLEPEAAERFRVLVFRRLQGEPVAYLVGQREFHGLAFRVNPDVLIPRPETELLVDAALDRLPVGEAREIADLGTGSGCVAIAIARARPKARVVAVDCSTPALNVAADNAARLGVQPEFVLSDWYEGLAGRRFDLIVSNPPYVAEHDPHLARGDLRFEPRSALAAGPDGISDIRRIIAGAARHLCAGGWLLFEHGHDQQAICRDLLLDTGFSELVSIEDLAGLPRISGGRLLTAKSPTR